MNTKTVSRYDLTKEEAKDLCIEFLKTVKRPDSLFGCYEIPGTSKYANIGRYIERKVFDETFKNDAKIMLQEYGPYDHASILFVVVDHEKQMPVAALRVIEHSEVGLKTNVDLINTPLKLKPEHIYDGYNVEPTEIVDIGTLAVEREYRGRKYGFIPSLLLYRAVYTQVVINPKNKLVVSIIDEKAYERLLKLGMPFKPLFNSSHFTYLDSNKSYAVHAYTSDFLPSVRRKARLYLWSVSPTKRYTRRLMLKLMHGRDLDHMMGYQK